MAYDKIWDTVHGERNWGRYPKEELVRWTFKNFGNEVSQGAEVLDVGCGQGSSSLFLAREGFRVEAVDGSRDALIKLKERSRKDYLYNIHCQEVCLTKLPFADKVFDFVVDVVSSAHNPRGDVVKIFHEMARVLKPCGKLFSMFPTNRCSRRPFHGLGHVSFMEREEVDLLLARDFVNVEVLKSSYQLAPECLVENWVISGTRAAQGTE